MNEPIHPVTQRETVEVHLPDGRVLSGPRGACAGDFLKTIEKDLPAPITGAIINGELRELTYPIQMEAALSPVSMADADGARIYRRSLTFLLGAAFGYLYPDDHLTIDHSVSSGGYYCQIANRPPLSREELAALDHCMRTWVAENAPFRRQKVALAEAKAYFEGKGYYDKVRLLDFRQKEYVTLYRVGDYLDYHHGYMVPSAGYLKWFKLRAAGKGFILQFPQRKAPTRLLPMSRYPKLLAAFQQYGQWLERLGIDSVGALDEAIRAGRSREVLLVSEALHEHNISDIAHQIARRSGQARVILIAGPSSSGKTTFSRRLAIQLLALGLSPFALELDSYFVDRDKTPIDEDGKTDFEALEAVDLGRLAEDLERLLDGKEVRIPHYNFKEGRREPGEVVQIRSDQPIIMEGIHGLNPRLVPGSLAGSAFRIYVSCLTQLNLDRHNRVPTTDTRLLRRILRDARARGYNAQQTIARWESVTRGEGKHIFPYQENADMMFNSALAYELSVLKPLVEPLLRQVPYDSPEHIEAKRLLAFLEWFLPVGVDLVPDNSILREFIGGSILEDFRVWKDA
jgi:uridine kinase